MRHRWPDRNRLATISVRRWHAKSISRHHWPPRASVRSVTQHGATLQERVATKRKAVAALRYACAAIERQQREPDPWERAYIKRGIDLLIAGAYDAVQPEVESALLAPAQRSLRAQPLVDPVLDRLTLVRLKRELNAAARKPVMPNPDPTRFRPLSRC